MPSSKLQGFARPLNNCIPWVPNSKPRLCLFALGRRKAEVRVHYTNCSPKLGRAVCRTEGSVNPKVNQDYVCLLLGKRRYMSPAGSPKIFDLLGCF